MKNIINKIFEEFEYKRVPLEYQNDDIRAYEIEKKAYFIVAYFDKKDLLEYFKSEKTNTIFTLFDALKNKREDANRNTSLLIFVKMDNLKNDCIELKNQIFKIEEDEYYFKKYIVTYDENSFKKIGKEKSISEFLNIQFSNEVNFNKFKKDNFCCSEYFFITQLFVKLPFLVFKQSDNQYQGISEKIEKKLDKDLSSFKNDYFLYKEKNKLVISDSLKDLITSENESDELNNFFDSLGVDDV